MQRKIALLVACILLAAALGACKGTDGTVPSTAGTRAAADTEAAAEEVAEEGEALQPSIEGETFETDRLSVTVPTGWESVAIDGGVQLYKQSGEIVEVYIRGYNQSGDWARQQAQSMADMYDGTEPRQVDKWGKTFWNTAFTAAGISQASYLCIENGETVAVKVAGPDYENDAETLGILESIRFKEAASTPTAAPTDTQPLQQTAAPTPTQAPFSIDDAVANMPDGLPAELTTFADLNQFATKLYLTYVKANIFQAPVFSEEEKDDARKAIELILAATDKAISLDGGEANLYYLRGNTYAQRYYDAKNAEDKEKALADLQKAVDMGLAAAQSAYDMLVGQ